MTDPSAQVRKLLRQQASIAGFGSFALQQSDLLLILNEAAKICAEGLGVPFSKVCRYRPEQNNLLIEAGFGWNDGIIGNVVSRADPTSPQGRAFVTGEPSICRDLRANNEFVLPSFYGVHGVVSTVDVIIQAKGEEKPYGVLEIDNNEQHDYDEHDINFLTSLANVLAEAVATAARTLALREVIAEKEQLLEQRNILAEELQHRVRNNMQLIYDMLTKQSEETDDPTGRRGIDSIARRVMTLELVHEHLLGSALGSTTNFADYATLLCRNISEVHVGKLELACNCAPFAFGLDTVTSLGIIIAELVTNAYDHAFPGGEGAIEVSMHPAAGDATKVRLVVSDNGTGFTPEYGSKRRGLGLVQRLVTQLRGTLSVASDHHTAWTIDFPLPKAMPVAPTTKMAARRQPELPSPQIH